VNAAARRATEPRRTDLLVRPPASARSGNESWAAALVPDSVAQLKELADLRERGLISQLEYEREKATILET
jgi:hypothetical protein